ncbi:MAG: VanZ family protein [Gemmatimonadaceae bacterium]|nr:VanZ family protein [Gemmatimonadaceae bacterium]
MMRGRWTWVLGWAVIIELLLLWPSPPEVPRLLRGIGFDKIVHAALFAVQAMLGAWALAGSRRPTWPALAGAIAFAALTELQQLLIPGRAMELGDFLADAAGAAVGLALFAALAPTRRELHR